jgi:hypothetical protein
VFGVENGVDRTSRNDMGGDIHNDNPGEEVNRFAEDTMGRHFGYPWCFSEFRLASSNQPGRCDPARFCQLITCFANKDSHFLFFLSLLTLQGKQWAWEATMNGVHDDAWCQAPENVGRLQQMHLANELYFPFATRISVNMQNSRSLQCRPLR